MPATRVRSISELMWLFKKWIILFHECLKILAPERRDFCTWRQLNATSKQMQKFSVMGWRITILCTFIQATWKFLYEKMSTSVKRTEKRAVIKFCAMSGMTPTDTWKFLNQKEGVHNCSRTRVTISAQSKMLRTSSPKIGESQLMISQTPSGFVMELYIR
jgi:hypothetical protein